MNETPHKHAHAKDYWPLLALIIICLLGATAIAYPLHGGRTEWMHYFMGLFFCAFAMLKIFDLRGFSNGFLMYDQIARQVKPYAFVYPFIELALGLGYLSFIEPVLVYQATLLLMTVSAVSVLIALRRGLNLYCPCMGNVLKVPLSTVTLTEDVAMGGMALFMLLG